MIHDRVDIQKWTQVFGLADLREDARRRAEHRRSESPKEFRGRSAFESYVRQLSPGGEAITSPFQIAVVEQLRAESLGRSGCSSVPTDVFVFAKGEPENRAVTKIGGVPFWPRTKRWPTGGSGRRMTFIGQFCFADSRDLVGVLPGDLLLVFADGVYGEDWGGSDKDGLQFDWLKLSENDLIGQQEVPKGNWDIQPVYGCVHRTVDYIDAYERIVDVYRNPYCIDVIEGTKTGGLPRWIQGEEEVQGQFLCALGSIWPASSTPFPYLNISEPFDCWSPEGSAERDRLLMWDDVGCLNIFLADDGAIHWDIQSY